MKSKTLKGIVIGALCLVLLGAAVMKIANESNSLKEYSGKAIEFNSSEKHYIENHPEINICVDRELSYLSKGAGRAFLQNYVNVIFAKTPMKGNIVSKREGADCSIKIVTEKVRKRSNEINFTAPVFQVAGKLYKRDSTAEKKLYTGVAMADRMSAKELDRIKYNDIDVSWTLVETAEEAVRYADRNKTDFILGDEVGIETAFNGKSDYIGIKDSLYKYNVCIVTDKNADDLAAILNQSIHCTNRKLVSYQMSEKWLGNQELRYMEKDYGDFYVLVLIIVIAVFIAFFIYYHTNKNLYEELSDRMNKLAESKKELQTTMGSIGHYMAEMSTEGNIIDINNAFYAFTGGNVANRKIWDVLEIEDDDRELLKSAILSIDKEGPISCIEIKSKNKIIDIDVHPIDNARGNVEKLLFMAMDVTNERMVEKQMLQDNKMIAVGQLAAGIAHEIRNPLGIIRNYCYVLKNIDDEELRKKAVEQIEKAVNNSGTIIDSLLNFSRISTKVKVNLDIRKHIESLLLLNKSVLKEKNIKTEIKCEEDIKTKVIEESLDMVIINLVSNAAAAMEENGILTFEITRGKNDFRITVADTGCGIDEGDLKEIFNPFFTTKGNSGGTGLGLYIVYNEVSKMNGRITVESEVGTGTRFTVTLPVEDITDDDAE